MSSQDKRLIERPAFSRPSITGKTLNVEQPKSKVQLFRTAIASISAAPFHLQDVLRIAPLLHTERKLTCVAANAI